MLRLTAEIVSSYLSRNPVREAELPPLISQVYRALSEANGGRSPAAESIKPAVPIAKSVRPDSITCLECGKSHAMLRRHLMTAHELTPDDYRNRWNLPRSYPLTSPNYAKTRSMLAKKNGLGAYAKAKAAAVTRGRSRKQKG